MGGQIVGNENNRDDNEAGGGANYVAARFGKVGDPDSGRTIRARYPCRFI